MNLLHFERCNNENICYHKSKVKKKKEIQQKVSEIDQTKFLAIVREIVVKCK